MIKLVGKNDQTQYLHSLQLYPLKIIINYKEKKSHSNSPVEKHGSHHLIQVIKINIITSENINTMCLWKWCCTEGTKALLYIFAKPKLNQEETSDNLKLKVILQNNYPVLLASVKIMKGKVEKLFRIKGN